LLKGMKKSVLIIEDDECTLEILGYITESLNFNPTLKSGVVPLTEIEEISPDLILLDHKLRDELGGNLCRSLKQHQKTKDIPVVIFSASREANLVAEKCGADGFFPKPFDIADFEQLLNTYLG